MLRAEYFITLALTVSAGVASYFDPILAPIAALCAAMLAHLHALTIKGQQVEDAVSAAVDARLGEDWDYVKHRLKSINDHLSTQGIGETYKNKRPAYFGG